MRNISKIGLQYVESLIDVVDKRLHKTDFNLITKIKRAIQVSISMNASELIERAKKAAIKLEDEIGENDKPGLWGFSFDILINNKNVSLSHQEEESIITNVSHKD